MFATILIVIVVAAAGVLLVHVFPVEKGTPSGANAPAPDQHTISGWGWVVVVVFALISMGIASHPRTNPFFSAAWETMGHPAQLGSTVVSDQEVPGTSATAENLTPSQEGIRLMEKHFRKIKYVGGKLTNFEKIGDGWFWNVIDMGLSKTVGQKVIGNEYKLADPSAGTPIVYLARVKNGVMEYGDPRPFPIP